MNAKLAGALGLAMGAATWVAARTPQVTPAAAFAITGTAASPIGSIPYTYHFDHNALIDGVTAGGSVVALTASGNLLRFDTDTLSLSGQTIVSGRGTALGRDDGGTPLIGTDDGRVGTVDPETLAPSWLAQVRGSVRWMSRSADRLVIVSQQTRWLWPGENDQGDRHGQWLVSVADAGRRTEWNLPSEMSGPDAFIVGPDDTLWIGSDFGEFGGRAQRMDLATGRVRDIPTDQPIDGFVLMPDGRVLAYGGTFHFGLTSTFIADARADALHPIFTKGFDRPTATDPDHPDGPIGHIIVDPAGGFLVASGHRLYHATTDFSTWSFETDLGGSWTAGRAYSVGSSATLARILPGPRPRSWIAIRGANGIQRIADGVVRGHAFDGQLQRPILEIARTPMGLAWLPSSSERGPSVWQRSPNGWTEVPLCPPSANTAPLPGNVLGGDDRSLVVHCSASDPDIFAFIDAAGHVTTETFDDPKTSTFFRGPDGRVLAIAPFDDDHTLAAIERSRAVAVGTTDYTYDFSTHWGPAARDFVPLISLADHASLYLDAHRGRLLRLAHPASGAWRLSAVEDPALTRILDAVPDGADAILVATPDGVYRYTAAGARTRIEAPVGDVIRSVTGDASGRLWAVGGRLYVSSRSPLAWTPVDLPMVSLTEAPRVRSDPASPGTLYLSLYTRGVVILDLPTNSR